MARMPLRAKCTAYLCCINWHRAWAFKGRIYSDVFFTSLATSFVCVLWFRQFSLSGLVLNPLLVPTVSLLSCSVGVFAFLVFLIGVDPHGFCIDRLSWVLGFAEDSIHRISMTSFSVFALNTMNTIVLGIVLGAVLVGEGVFAFRRGMKDL